MYEFPRIRVVSTPSYLYFFLSQIFTERGDWAFSFLSLSLSHDVNFYSLKIIRGRNIEKQSIRRAITSGLIYERYFIVYNRH